MDRSVDKKTFLKASNFCAYQERTHNEVRKRLADWQVYGEEAEEMIILLIEENFLNEERFAKAFAGGKFRIKKWGRNRILQELKIRGLSTYCIKQGLKEIDDHEYLNTIESLLLKKIESLSSEPNDYIRKRKAAEYLIRKGFESQLVYDTLNEVTSLAKGF
jgi:regulatory protein